MANYIYGLHSVQALLTQKADQAYALYVQRSNNPKIAEIIQLAKQQGIAVEQANKDQLDRLTEKENHQGVVLRIKQANLATENELYDLLDSLKEPPFLLILDEIQDPHNLGACLRSAAAVGVNAVIMPRMRSVGLTPTARKVASGAAEVLHIFAVTNLARCMRELRQRGIWLIGAAANATQSLYTTDLTGPLAIVMGNEGTGLRRLTSEHCDLLASIPMNNTISSLNVSVATGICLFEARRQRNKL